MKKISRQLSKREKILSLVVIFLVLQIFLYKKLYLKNEEKYKSIIENNNLLIKELSNIDEYKSKETIDEFDYLTINLEKIIEKVDSYEDSLRLYNLEIKDIGPLGDSHLIYEKNMRLEVIGRLDNLIEFLDYMEKNTVYTYIENLEFSVYNQEIKMELDLFLYDINYKFKDRKHENKEINKMPFLIENTSDINGIGVNKNLETDKYLRIQDMEEANTEKINFQYKDIEKGNKLENSIENFQYDNEKILIKTFNKNKLKRNILEIKFNQLQLDNSIEFIINFIENEIKDDIKLSISSDGVFLVNMDIIFSNGDIEKEYSKKLEVDENIKDLKLSPSNKNMYLSRINFEIETNKETGVIYVEIN